MQAPQLRDHQEQSQHAGASGTGQILPLVPQAHKTPGDPLGELRATSQFYESLVRHLEGRKYGPHPLRVSREKVSEFVEVTRDSTDRWQKEAPPGWAAAALFIVAPRLLADPDLEKVARSVIHGEQRFAWNGPIAVEADLQVTGRITRVRERSNVFLVGFDIEVTDASSTLVSGASTFVMSGTEPPGGKSPEVNEPGPLESGRNDPIQPESEFTPIRRSASRADLVRYAAATRDWNPIHWDHAAAVEAGLGGIVVHGLLQAAWLLSGASRLNERPDPFIDARFRFRSPLLAGTEATVKGGGSPTTTASLTEGDREIVSATINLR
jgi:hydroxyacyl-ACP dehydratase HTD2-like protein with hotdog domain